MRAHMVACLSLLWCGCDCLLLLAGPLHLLASMARAMKHDMYPSACLRCGTRVHCVAAAACCSGQHPWKCSTFAPRAAWLYLLLRPASWDVTLNWDQQRSWKGEDLRQARLVAHTSNSRALFHLPDQHSSTHGAAVHTATMQRCCSTQSILQCNILKYEY